MYIKQSDLLWGLDKHFIQDFVETGIKDTYPKGSMLFKEGDPADSFYILVKGSVRLSLGEQNRTTYLVNHAGEAFGWSSLVGLKNYTASAECLKESVIIRFAKESILAIAEVDPLNGMEFYKRLARMLGDRLIHSYRSENTDVSEGLELSFGSGQNIESYTTS
jgi:CRP/FNR family transcriptional regulator, cyclic AMP receptor protein